MGPDLDEVEQIFETFRSSWDEFGREGRPTIQLSFWFALGDHAPERMASFAGDYLSIFGEAFAKKRSPHCGATSTAEIRDILNRLEDMGCDEAILAPTTASLDELSAAEDFVSGL